MTKRTRGRSSLSLRAPQGRSNLKSILSPLLILSLAFPPAPAFALRQPEKAEGPQSGLEEIVAAFLDGDFQQAKTRLASAFGFPAPAPATGLEEGETFAAKVEQVVNPVNPVGEAVIYYPTQRIDFKVGDPGVEQLAELLGFQPNRRLMAFRWLADPSVSGEQGEPFFAITDGMERVILIEPEEALKNVSRYVGGSHSAEATVRAYLSSQWREGFDALSYARADQLGVRLRIPSPRKLEEGDLLQVTVLEKPLAFEPAFKKIQEEVRRIGAPAELLFYLPAGRGVVWLEKDRLTDKNIRSNLQEVVSGSPKGLVTIERWPGFELRLEIRALRIPGPFQAGLEEIDDWIIDLGDYSTDDRTRWAAQVAAREGLLTNWRQALPALKKVIQDAPSRYPYDRVRELYGNHPRYPSGWQRNAPFAHLAWKATVKNVVEILGELGPKAEATAELLKVLRIIDAERRMRYSDAYMLEGLISSDVRRLAIMALAKSATPSDTQAVPVLRRIAGDAEHYDENDRRGAIEALGKIGPSARGAVPALRRIRVRDPSESVRVAADQALKKVSPAGGLEEVKQLAADLQAFSRRTLASVPVSVLNDAILLDLTMTKGELLLPYLPPDTLAIARSRQDLTTAVQSAPARDIPSKQIIFLEDYQGDFSRAVRAILPGFIEGSRRVRLLTWRSAEEMTGLSGIDGLILQSGTPVEQILVFLWEQDQDRRDFMELLRQAQANAAGLEQYL